MCLLIHHFLNVELRLEAECESEATIAVVIEDSGLPSEEDRAAGNAGEAGDAPS